MSALSLDQPRGRWVVAATVAASGMALLDSTIVNIALPAINDDLDAGTAGLTWTVNAYTLTLSALILLGGSLGDRLGRRRVFVVGVVWFAGASLLCGIAPNVGLLVAARGLQGIGGALLTPGSLAILQASFRPEDRSRAIGIWSGFGATAAVIGPLLGGWLLEIGSWRWVFLVNLPVAALVLLLARHIPETKDADAPRRSDFFGVACAVVGLGGLTYGLTVGSLPMSLLGAAGLVTFVVHEGRTAAPMMPLDVFRSRAFSATNLVTFLVYAALSGMVMWLVVALQVVSLESPMRAGFALLPLTVCMLLFSPLAGTVSDRIGPTIPMSVGPLIMAGSVVALTRVDAQSSYLVDVIAPTVVFGIGLATMVTPLTATALAAVPDHRAGIASGVNNAVARIGGLLAIAVLPLVTQIGPDGFDDAATLQPAFVTAMWICAGLLAAGGLLAAALVRRPRNDRRPPDLLTHGPAS
ncbi:MAG TPA: MFS transporter [Aeromicrobium sp.]|nr:MFS transporter [Aeromicrobium sp.]HKY58094.1 MFS transporter [Aeromicrobium sp.]